VGAKLSEGVNLVVWPGSSRAWKRPKGAECFAHVAAIPCAVDFIAVARGRCMSGLVV
jgi:hypothetical protein